MICLYAAPAESKIQDAGHGPGSTELHASPDLCEFKKKFHSLKTFSVFNLQIYDNVCLARAWIRPESCSPASVNAKCITLQRSR